MKGRIFYSYLAVLLCTLGLTTHSLAQTITNISTPTTICSGSNITIQYTTSATSFSTGNVFKAYLSDATGFISTSSPVIGSVIATTSGTISATVPAGTTAGSGYHIGISASNPSKAIVTNTVLITINSPAAPNVSTPAPYCEGATASALIATPSSGGSLNWYGANQTGGTASSIPTTPNTSLVGNTLYYVSQTIGGIGGCESSRVPITVTVQGKPGAPGTSPLTYCVGQQASSLSATPVANATLNWYTVPSGGTASSITPVPSTTSPGSTTYYVSQTLNGCEGPRASLVVTVNSIPPAPAGTTPAPYCEGASATALSASGQNLLWYGTSQTGGTGSSSATIPSTSNTGTYYVSQTVNGCESTRTGITVTVNPKPSTPVTTPAPSYCQNQSATALVATPSTSATLNWYGTNANGGTPSAIPNTPNTSQAGTFNYYVSQTLNGCESSRVGISVTVKSTPVAPSVSTPIIACQTRAASALSATPSSGGSLNWYGTSSTGGTPTTGPPTVSTNSLGSTTYYVSQSINGCEGPRAALIFTVNSIPALPSIAVPNAYCEGTNASVLSASGQSLQWYGTSQTGGSASTNAPVPSTSASFIGTTLYYVTQTVNSCESERASIPVQVKDTPDAPGTSGIDFCQGTSAPTLTASLVANATPNWYGTSANGGTASSSAPTPSNSTPGTTVYYVSQTLSSCEGPRASISVRVKATPGAPGVSSISFCNNGPAQPLTANGTTLKWYDASDNSLGSAPTPDTRTVGNQVYKVSQISSEGCEGAKASITVTINPLPGLPSVSNITYCQSQQDQPAQNVQALSAGGSNLKWYNTDGNQFPNAPTPSVNQAGTQLFHVSQTVNNCEGLRADIIVTIVTLPAPATPKSLVTYCINDNAVPLQAIGQDGAQLKWIDPYGNVSSVAPTPYTLNTSINPQGDPFYVYQIGTNGCYSPRATIRSLVNAPPTLALVAPTSTVNLGQRAPLQLKFTSAGPFSYTLTGGNIGTSNTTDTTISVLPRGNTIYQVVTVSNSCGVGLPGNPATAQVTVRVPTISTSSLTSSTLCSGTSLSVPFTTTGQFNNGNAFRIELVSSTDTTKKYAVAAASTGSPVSGVLPSTLPSGQYFVRVKADNPEIAIIGSNSPTPLTVRSLASAVLTGTQTIYAGVPANLTLTFGGEGPWTATYADSLYNYSVTATASPYLVEARPVRTTTYLLKSVTNSCGSGPISGKATITVAPLLGVEDTPLDPLVKTYPVPTETTLIVELNLPLTHDPATLSLTDLGGQPVLQQTTRNQLNKLDLTSQPSGIYLLRIQVGDRQTVRKVLKQ